MTNILDCGHSPSPHSEFTDGIAYQINEDNSRTTMCYDCAAEADREFMREHKQIWLYLTEYKTSDGRKFAKVGNWPNSLRIKVDYIWSGDHNWLGCEQIYIYFRFENRVWYGRQVSSGFHQLIHVKELKHLPEIYKAQSWKWPADLHTDTAN